jgi:hypothetical protein
VASVGCKARGPGEVRSSAAGGGTLTFKALLSAPSRGQRLVGGTTLASALATANASCFVLHNGPAQIEAYRPSDGVEVILPALFGASARSLYRVFVPLG